MCQSTGGFVLKAYLGLIKRVDVGLNRGFTAQYRPVSKILTFHSFPAEMSVCLPGPSEMNSPCDHRLINAAERSCRLRSPFVWWRVKCYLESLIGINLESILCKACLGVLLLRWSLLLVGFASEHRRRGPILLMERALGNSALIWSHYLSNIFKWLSFTGGLYSWGWEVLWVQVVLEEVCACVHSVVVSVTRDAVVCLVCIL